MSTLIIMAVGLILFGLCVSTDRMIGARQARTHAGRDQKSYL